MKNILFIILALLLSFWAMAQQVPESKVINATMPKGAKLLTKEQLVKYVHNNYKISQIRGDRKNIYQLDGLLISFWDLTVNPEFQKKLQDSQSEILSTLRLVDNIIPINSKIVAVNNINFLVYEYRIEDEVYLRFQSEYNKNNENICGIIQFKVPDEDKAHAALQTFLQSVHFKE